jgi:DNA-binding MarR family transcriptional regulator
MARRQTPTDEELTDLFVATSHQLRRLVNARLADAGLSLTSASVLRRLAETNDMAMGRLSKELGIAPRSLTSTVDALEADGLVTRTTHPADRRSTLLTITAAGRRQLSAMRHVMGPSAAKLLSSLTAAQRRDMAQILEQMRTAANTLAIPDADQERDPGARTKRR